MLNCVKVTDYKVRVLDGESSTTFRAVPSVMLALAVGQPEKEHRYPHHHPQVTLDENALPGGAAAYAYIALRWLEEHA